MATSDWRGLYTIPEQDYGGMYTNTDDWMSRENKVTNQKYRHRAYRGSSSIDVNPGLTPDYGVKADSLKMERIPSMQKQQIEDTFEVDARKAGEIFEGMRNIAEDIGRGK